MNVAGTQQPESTSIATRGPLSQLVLAARDIKLAHSVFALPFAILAAFLAFVSAPASAPIPTRDIIIQLALIIACMVLARTWAMLVNRLADQGIDAANPRTHRRALASGALRRPAALAIAFACAALFILTTSAFYFLFANPWPVFLSIPVLAFIALYSFTKRFTALCHLFLGLALAMSPLAAAIAVRPAALGEIDLAGSVALGGFGVGLTLYLLAAMVALWVAGFDIIYALQDIDFDRGAKLHSIPAWLGPTGAIWTSRILHALAFLCLLAAAATYWRFGPIFDAAVGLVGVLLILEHIVLAIRGKAGLEMAFFTLNGVVSCVLGVAGVVDLIAV